MHTSLTVYWSGEVLVCALRHSASGGRVLASAFRLSALVIYLSKRQHFDSIRGAALSTGGRVSHPYSCSHPVAEVHYWIRVCGTEYWWSRFAPLLIAGFLIYHIQYQ